MPYRNPPAPYLRGWQHVPVPGWGVNPAVAGPRRIGVGQAPRMVIGPGVAQPVVARAFARQEAAFPWVYVGAGVLVAAALGALAYNRGWI